VTGDDVLTTGQVPEIQRITCECAGACSGKIRVRFRGEESAAIDAVAVATIAQEDPLSSAAVGKGESVEAKLEVGATSLPWVWSHSCG
jgi:hypothetical protein